MITTLRPPVTTSGLDLDELRAESTPEARAAVAAYSALFKLFFDKFLVCHGMVPGEVVPEALLAVADFLTVSFVAVPGLQLVMLAALVPLPVILATKGFVTGAECTAVGLFMSLHVFSAIALVLEAIGRE